MQLYGVGLSRSSAPYGQRKKQERITIISN